VAIDNYLDNITSQHRDKPKFIGWLSSNLTIIDDAYILLKSMDDAFDVDNAIGAQLDTLGVIIGRQRTLSFQPLNNYSPVLDDDTYRVILKAKIIMNNWDGSLPQMYEVWNAAFGKDKDLNLQLQDNQDMSFIAYIDGFVDQIQQDLIQHGYIVPKPEGVRVNYIGRSKIPFDLYSAIIVSVCQTEVLTMDFDQTEYIGFNNVYSRIIVQQIKTETLNISNEVVEISFLVNENNEALTTDTGAILIF